MYRILEGSETGIVGIKVEGTLSSDEYDLLNSYLEQLMQEVGPINFLCEMADLEIEKGQSLWKEMNTRLRSLRNYQKIALVGDRRWPEDGITDRDSSLNRQVKYFAPEHIHEAWDWVKVP